MRSSFKTQVVKIGNSEGITIPKQIREYLAIEIGDLVIIDISRTDEVVGDERS